MSRKSVASKGVIPWLVAAALLAGVAGLVWPDGDAYNAELAATIGTAFGTAILAIATYRLATTTSGLAEATGQDVRSSEELARMAAEDREIRDRPLVHVTKRGVDGGTLVLDVHNYGNGSAVALHLYPASERWNELEPVATIQLVELGHTEYRIQTATLATYHLEHETASIDTDRWGVRYLNRWRTYSYASFDGSPPTPERFTPFIIGQTPLADGQLW
jgi:hypothetical protein